MARSLQVAGRQRAADLAEMMMSNLCVPEPSIGRPLRGPDLDAFLGRGLTARFACHDAAGWPYAVPVWHLWDGAGFWLVAAKDAAWVRWIREDPRVAICVDEPATLCRVMCQGTARVVEGPTADGRWNGIARQMAILYLGQDAVPAYEASTAGLERWLIRVESKRLVSWAGPGRGELRS